eukprot:TRINITY_DN6508_c0_g1_i1.p1 TRINITY_DN6508_c0_g1~~TRINITY_DN6508_c0_g1_i1.p1  ORF type:complete len:600 (-),score=73.54 TRINITY_DN6508_c0_g1_i1:154-1953(-)
MGNETSTGQDQRKGPSPNQMQQLISHFRQASESGDESKCLAMIRAGVTVNIIINETYGTRAVHLAAWYNQPKLLRDLAASGADIEAADNAGLHPLHTAAFRGSIEAAECLLSLGAELIPRDNHQLTPLHTAALENQIQFIRYIIHKGITPDVRDGNGLAPLNSAIIRGHVRSVDALVKAGAHLESKNKWGGTALFSAAFEGNLECVERLLAHGALLESKDANGLTVLQGACYKGNTAMVAFLLSKGANPELTNNAGRRAVHVAARQGKIDCVDILARHGADIDAALVAASKDPSDVQDLVAIPILERAQSSIPNRPQQVAAHPRTVIKQHSTSQAVPAGLSARVNANLADEDLLSQVAAPIPLNLPASYVPPERLGDDMLIQPILLSAVPQLPYIVAESLIIATDRMNNQKLPANCALDLNECLALALYSFELGMMSTTLDGSDNLYYTLNEQLRLRKLPFLLALRSYIYYFKAAWNKLPILQTTAYRGLPSKALTTIEENYQLGREIHWSAITSVTLDKRVAESFAQCGTPNVGVVVEINVIDGRSISSYSALPVESEILLHPGASLIVTQNMTANKSAKSGATIKLIQMSKTGKFTF